MPRCIRFSLGETKDILAVEQHLAGVGRKTPPLIRLKNVLFLAGRRSDRLPPRAIRMESSTTRRRWPRNAAKTPW